MADEENSGDRNHRSAAAPARRRAPGRSNATPQALQEFLHHWRLRRRGTSLWRKGVGGRATEAIEVNGVPDDADVVAAYLYVQTAEVVQWSGIDHARFNGVDLGAGTRVGRQGAQLGRRDAAVLERGLGGGRRMVTYRADVLRFLPIGNNGKTRRTARTRSKCRISGSRFPTLDEGGARERSGTGSARRSAPASWSSTGLDARLSGDRHPGRRRYEAGVLPR